MMFYKTKKWLKQYKPLISYFRRMSLLKSSPVLFQATEEQRQELISEGQTAALMVAKKWGVHPVA